MIRDSSWLISASAGEGRMTGHRGGEGGRGRAGAGGGGRSAVRRLQAAERARSPWPAQRSSGLDLPSWGASEGRRGAARFRCFMMMPHDHVTGGRLCCRLTKRICLSLRHGCECGLWAGERRMPSCR